jgi:magnesium-transporting ATPase (P-type)
MISGDSLETASKVAFNAGIITENQIAQDTEILTILTDDLIRQQGNQEPLRTRDLANPYGSSLQQDPSYYIPFTP